MYFKWELNMKKILVVDDEPAVLNFLTMVAQSLQYEVLKAKDGIEALLTFDHDEAIDALITDIKMPGMNGFQLAENLRMKRPDLPILFISGFFNEFEAPTDMLDDDGVHFLPKPFTPQELGSGLLLLFASLSSDNN